MPSPYTSAIELARMICEGETSSEALLEAMLERLDARNPELNAVIYLDADTARARAREADAALARGENWGPLHGLPMTIKETYEVSGMPTTAGSPSLKEHISPRDAVVVERLQGAGAIIVGKTNVPLYAGDLQSYNEIYGTTNNPWDLQRGPGGSSGGSAAALAAGLTALEYGSDIGGSIRIPASFCGVFGHKSSYGIVPARGHVPGPPGSLSAADINVMGPLARSVDDLELALNVTAGPDRDMATAWQLNLPPARQQRLQDFRVAAWLDDPACPVDKEIVSILQNLLEKLRESGVAVDEQARPEGINLADSHDVYYNLLTAALGARMSERVFRKQQEIIEQAGEGDDDYQLRFARGVTQSHSQWLGRHEERLQMRERWAEFFQRFDVMLCPVTHTLPFKHDHSSPQAKRTLMINGEERAYMDILVWVGLAGVVYLPVTVVPAGRTKSGLPVGVQIIGPYLEDRTCLQFARHLEELLGGFVAPPGF